MADKAILRCELRRRRAALTLTQRLRAQAALARHARPLLRRGTRIGAYMALGSELSLAPLIDLARRRGAELYLPVVPRQGRVMHFAALDRPGGYWRRNRYGIAEYRTRTPLAAGRLDVVLLPLVGFDDEGHRLGQGGGYYDATFAFRRLRRHWRKPRLIGVAFDCQRVECLPVEPHDVPLDGMLTESGLVFYRR